VLLSIDEKGIQGDYVMKKWNVVVLVVACVVLAAGLSSCRKSGD
jgi:hypothetical protein